ncbi:MAG: hypothetical protein B7Z12_22235 [Caulobacter vibrioides]|uniref:Mannose-6-phosphate isomerase n=1 Tax=Caulobacter vibrioides TaxID=155892 RepID=A0A258CNC6_CAUVI|nr:MAG: hypothetical protein B7Z12_22235 [Caulobacter vibrioides]
MFERALPFWAWNGIDSADGGYVEQLTLDGRDAGVAFKRTRVTARQVYTFSHARVLGWDGGGDKAATGIDFLINRAWQGPDKGFARTVSRKGEVIDPTPDLYDHAFALFAFAWRHRAHRDMQSRDWMHRTLDFIETHMDHHALEASGEARFAEASGRLVQLFQKRLLDRSTGMLPEYFTDDWRRVPGEEGRLVEPGHMMEWAWILNQARKLIGADTADDIRALAGLAERIGVDPVSGITYNAVRNDGTPLDKGSRTWPNTERIKAAVALFELDGVDPAGVINEAGGLLLSRYLTRDPLGTWMDAFDANGNDAARVVPASTLYHIFLAFAEVLRIAD